MPPYTTSSSGCSATSGSRLFISMRSGASVSQLFADRTGPRGARITRSLCLVHRFLTGTALAGLTGSGLVSPRPGCAGGQLVAQARVIEMGDADRLATGPGAAVNHEAGLVCRHPQHAAYASRRVLGANHVFHGLQWRNEGQVFIRRRPGEILAEVARRGMGGDVAVLHLDRHVVFEVHDERMEQRPAGSQPEAHGNVARRPQSSP